MVTDVTYGCYRIEEIAGSKIFVGVAFLCGKVLSFSPWDSVKQPKNYPPPSSLWIKAGKEKKSLDRMSYNCGVLSSIQRGPEKNISHDIFIWWSWHSLLVNWRDEICLWRNRNEHRFSFDGIVNPLALIHLREGAIFILIFRVTKLTRARERKIIFLFAVAARQDFSPSSFVTEKKKRYVFFLFLGER